MKWPLIC